MALIAPDSKVTLYQNVDITNEQQIAFPSKASQTSYFNSKKLREKVNCTYVRRNGRLKIEDSMNLMQTCNYISFTNQSMEGITIYARVADFIYVNNVTVEIQFVVDWFQTFMFDVSYEDCMIEREHLSVYDYNKAESNPYDPSIYEFQTSENLEVSKELEPIYELGDSSSSDSYFVGSSTKQYKRKLILMPVATFDISELENFQENFINKCDFVITTTGFYFGKNGVFFSGDKPGHPAPTGNPFYDLLRQLLPDAGSIDFATAHGYNIYGFCNTYSDESVGRAKNLADCLNYLTLNGLTSEILGIYQVDYFYFMSLIKNDTGNLMAGIGPRSNVNVNNKKLLLSPYEYIRVEGADGNIKEYKYELFDEFVKNDGTKTADLFGVGTFEGQPVLNVLPKNYKYKNTKVEEDFDYNKDERIEYTNYPMIPYNIDNYLSFLNQQFSYNLGTRTTGSKEVGMVGQIAKFAGDTFSAIVSPFTSKGKSASSSASSATGLPSDIANTANYYHGNNESDMMRKISADDASAIASGDVVSAVYNVAKPAYIADEYHPGSVGDTLSYILGNETGSVFKITRVHLKDSIVRSYDRYFTMYGYNSKRIGLPRICGYIKGEQSTTKTPKFMTMPNGKSATYVKTQNMHVESTMLPVSQFIEQMFNNGMRFVDGTTL